VSGDVGTVLAGIANTSLGLLQQRKKSSFPVQWSVHSARMTRDVARARAAAMRKSSIAAHCRVEPRLFVAALHKRRWHKGFCDGDLADIHMASVATVAPIRAGER